MAAINLPAMGFREGFGISLESTYGTAVDPAVWFNPISNDLKRRDGPIAMSGMANKMTPYLFTGEATNNNRWFYGTKDVSGTVVIEAEYDDIGNLLKCAFGDLTTTDANPLYTHEFKVLDSATGSGTSSSLPSFTAARLTGVEDFQFTGCMIDRLEISARENQIVSVSMDVVAQDMTQTDDLIGSFSTTPFMRFEDSVVRIDTAQSDPAEADNLDSGEDAIDWTFTLNNNLRRVGTAARNQGSSTDYNVIREPIFSDFRQTSITFSADYFSDDRYDLLFNDGAVTGAGVRNMEVYLDSGVVAASATNYQLTINLERAVLMGEMPGFGGGAGPLPQTLTFMGAAATGQQCIATLVNATSSY